MGKTLTVYVETQGKLGPRIDRAPLISGPLVSVVNLIGSNDIPDAVEKLVQEDCPLWEDSDGKSRHSLAELVGMDFDAKLDELEALGECVGEDRPRAWEQWALLIEFAQLVRRWNCIDSESGVYVIWSKF